MHPMTPLFGLPDVTTLDIGTEAIVSGADRAAKAMRGGCSKDDYFRFDLNKCIHTCFTIF